jgi:hypothetical protein
MGMALRHVRYLSGRSAAFCLCGHGGRLHNLGGHRQHPPASGFFRNLEISRQALGISSAASEKNLPNYKNFICILEKMGYNKVE